MSATVNSEPSMVRPESPPSSLPVFQGNPQSGNNDNGYETLLLTQMRSQIEFYFCPRNLATDHFLMSQLRATDHINAVPIEIIANFPKVRELYALAKIGPHVPPHLAPPADPQLLRSALQGSSIVTVSDDGLWITPTKIPSTPMPLNPPLHHSMMIAPFDATEWNQKAVDQAPAATTAATVASATVGTTVTTTSSTIASTPSSPSSQTTSSSLGVPADPLTLKERNTVIAREIPENTTENEILKVFTTDSVTPKSARPDVGNTWFVTFDSESDAVEALSATRDRTIRGATIRGRLKSELTVPLATNKGTFHKGQPVGFGPQSHTFPHDPRLLIPNLSSLLEYGGPQQMYYPPPYVQQQQQMTGQAAYNYLPYPYGLHPFMTSQHCYTLGMHHQHQAHLMQSQHNIHSHPSRRQPKPAESSAGSTSSTDNFTSPPPHVYFRPKQQQHQQQKQGNRKRPKRTKNKNRQQQNFHKDNAEGTIETAPSSDISSNSQIQDTKSNRGSANNDSTSNSNLLKKSQAATTIPRRHESSEQTSSNTSQIFSFEHFPALGGINKAPTEQNEKQSLTKTMERPAYAAALLKKPNVPSPSIRLPITDIGANQTKQLDAAMDKMAFSETIRVSSESYENW